MKSFRMFVGGIAAGIVLSALYFGTNPFPALTRTASAQEAIQRTFKEEPEQVKTFRAEGTDGENRINAWLKEANPNITRVTASGAGSGSGSHYLYIFYRK